ncbi:MAG: hypothetical protein ABI548_26545 [Polyangiaceae bacterium]
MDPDEQQFFEQGDQPLNDLPEEPTVVFEPATERVRRARLRRVVGAAVLASLALFGAGLLIRYSAGRGRAPLDARLSHRRVMFDALLPRAQAPAPALTVAASVASIPTSAASGAAPSSASEPTQLIRSARALLESGRTREGVAAARLAVDANANDAEPYILLAAGLQDEGRWAEAQTVFSTCKEKTSTGPNATCRYFAGH